MTGLAVGVDFCGLDHGCKANVRGLPESVEGHPLRQAINDVVVQWVTTKLQEGEPVDVGFMAREITHSPIDMGRKALVAFEGIEIRPVDVQVQVSPKTSPSAPT